MKFFLIKRLFYIEKEVYKELGKMDFKGFI